MPPPQINAALANGRFKLSNHGRLDVGLEQKHVSVISSLRRWYLKILAGIGTCSRSVHTEE